ncbi:helix-turn-helix transcriptional regulator [Klebsiella oxytoca]
MSGILLSQLPKDIPASSLIYIKEVASLLGLQPQTIRKWICHDSLPEGLPKPKKLNRKNCWLRTDIESFIATKFSNNSKF